MTSGSPDYQDRIITSASTHEQKKVTVSAADSTGTFSQQVKSVVVINDGPNPVHINLDAAAATSHFPIPAKSWFMVDVPVTVVHLICDTGESATCYCFGVY